MSETWCRFPPREAQRRRPADALTLHSGPIDDAPLNLELSRDRFLDHLQNYRQSAQGTIEVYTRDLRRFLIFVAAHYPEVEVPNDVTRQIIMAFALSLKHMSPRTVRRNIDCLCSLFGFLLDVGQSQHNPAHRIPLPEIPQGPPRVLSEEEAQRLVHAAEGPRDRCICLLLLSTGLRRNEAASICLADVDVSDGYLLVHGKGRRERTMPLRPETLGLIRDYLAWRGERASDRFFITARGKPATNRAISFAVRRAAQRAHLEGVTPHKLRHTFAAWLVQSGADVCTVHELLGQSRVGMVMTSDLRTKTRAVMSLPGLFV